MIKGARRQASSRELVGRREEIAELETLLDEARSGRSRFVLLGGDAGVGKTRLLREFRGRAENEDAWLLVGHCVDLGDSALPFAPISQILRAVVEEVDRRRLPELLGPTRRELTRIVPELGDWKPDRTPDESEWAQGRLFAAVRQALGALSSERPLVVVVEDIHWADASTLNLLTFVARNLGDDRLLVVASFRSDELHRRHRARPVITELARFPDVVRIELGPLDDEAVARQVEGILGRPPQPDVAREIAGRSGGNPFYVEELVAAHEGRDSRDVPSTLRAVVTSRLDELPQPTRGVLAQVAVVGRSVDHRLLETLSGMDPEELSEALRPAVDRHVLVVDDDRYRFRHDLVREIVEDDLLPGERTVLHRRVGEVLEGHPDLASGGAEQFDAELAHHWYVSHEIKRAFDASLRAADQARQAAAFAEALAHDERALELWDQADPEGHPDRVQVLARAADAAWAAGLYRRGITHLRAALDRIGDDPARQADLRRALGLTLWWDAKDHDAAWAEAERAYRLVEDLPASELKARVVHTRARLYMMGRREEAIPFAREATGIALEVGDRLTEAHARITLGSSLAFRGRVEEGVAELRRGVDLARDVGDPEASSRGYNNLVVGLRDMAPPDRDVVEEVVAEAISWLDAQEGRHGASHAILLANVAEDSVIHGDWGRAEALLDRMSRYHLEGHVLALFYRHRGALRWMQGRFAEAVADTERLHELRAEGPWFRGWAFTLDALVAASEGRLDDVRAAVDEGRQVLSPYGHPQDPTVMGLRLMRCLVGAEIDAALDATGGTRSEHLERATDTLATMRHLLERERPVTAGERYRAGTYLRLAEAEASRADDPDPGLWRAVIDRATYPYWRVYARWRLAESLLETDRREEAVAELRRTHEEAADLGAGRLRDEIEDLARRARIHLPGVEVTGADELGLTPRETEVLGLVADGCTNREIGEALYIAEKTASVHVSNILRKLDVDDRHEAAERARDLGLTTASP